MLRTVVLFHYTEYVGTDPFAIPLLPETRAYHQGPGNEAIRMILAFVFMTALANLLVTLLIGEYYVHI